MRSEQPAQTETAPQRLDATRRQFLFARKQVSAHVPREDRRADHHDAVFGTRSSPQRPEPA